MTIKTSTGLRNKMLVNDCFTGLMNGGSIKIYGGASSAVIPPDADAAATVNGATLLCTVTNNSTATGITFETAAASGVVTKTVAEVWSGVNAATNTAQFYRLVSATDTGASSATEARVQGTVGVAGADLNMSSVDMVISATQTVDYYSMALPTA